MEPVTAPVPQAPFTGLIASSRVVEEGTERWGNGFTFAPEGCAGGGSFAPCDPGTKDIPDNPGIMTVEPIGVWAGDKCSSFGFLARDYEGRARRLLEACESKQAEREFWRGDVARAQAWDNPFLTDGGARVLGDGETPVAALACLEQALADGSCGMRGMIHATRQLVTVWSASNLIRVEGNRLLTINGNLVVSGAGYDGSGPVPEDDVATPANLVATGAAGGALAQDTYGYRVSAITAYGESAATAEALGVVGVGQGSVDLTWDDVAGATGYRVYGRTEGGPWLLLASTVTSDYSDEGADVPAGAAAPDVAVNGPDPAGATQWAYATGMVEVRRTKIDILPGSLDDARKLAAAMNRDVNDIEVRAERLIGIAWDGCVHASVEVDLPVCAEAP